MRWMMVVVFVFLGTASAAAQTGVVSPIDTVPAQSGDIVVEGIRVPGEEASGIGMGDLSAGDPRGTAIAIRGQFEFSQRVADCAVRGKLSPISDLKAIVDGPPNYATQRYAQDILMRKNITCSEGISLLSMTPGFFGSSITDRGAYVIATLRRYAPGLTLTRKQTGDPVVQARFDRREVPRNRYRRPADYRYFQAAVCLVRLQPTLSVKLAMADLRPTQIKHVENAIVGGARICVGNARRVVFDPTQFRVYIADAVYRWGIAAQGIESFISAG